MLDMFAFVSDCRRGIAAAVVAGLMMAFAASSAPAQVSVVVVVNGDPITAFDVEQRMRFLQLANNKPPTRQQALDELIDERLKLQLTKRFDFSSFNLDTEVEERLNNLARMRRMDKAHFIQELASQGVQIGTLKSRIKAEIIWLQAVRGRYPSSFQLNETEVLKELETRKIEGEAAFDYSLRPITFIVPRGSPQATFETRRKEADGLRARFQNCDEGIPFARALRDVAVRDAVTRSSADLPPQLREVLEKTEVGHLTSPETTLQGIELYALCAKKPSAKNNTPGNREVRNEFFSKQFEINSKKFIKELRDQAYIVYK